MGYENTLSKNLKIVSLANSIKGEPSFMASQYSPSARRYNETVDLLHSVGSSIDSEDLENFSLFGTNINNSRSIEIPTKNEERGASTHEKL